MFQVRSVLPEVYTDFRSQFAGAADKKHGTPENKPRTYCADFRVTEVRRLFRFVRYVREDKP